MTNELGEGEILLSYSDMLDWKLLSKNFPRVPKIKTPTTAIRTKITVKKVKKTVTKKSLKNRIAPLTGDGVHSTSGEEGYDGM